MVSMTTHFSGQQNHPCSEPKLSRQRAPSSLHQHGDGSAAHNYSSRNVDSCHQRSQKESRPGFVGSLMAQKWFVNASHPGYGGADPPSLTSEENSSIQELAPPQGVEEFLVTPRSQTLALNQRTGLLVGLPLCPPPSQVHGLPSALQTVRVSSLAMWPTTSAMGLPCPSGPHTWSRDP